MRISTSYFNKLLEDKSILAQYTGSDEERMFQANIDLITERAKLAVLNESTLLVFPEDAFTCSEPSADKFIEQVKSIAKDNKINLMTGNRFNILRLTGYRHVLSSAVSQFSETQSTAISYFTMCTADLSICRMS